MRTLDIENMLRLLKEVSEKLEENDIKYDIPYVYKNKIDFDFMKIIIPMDLDVSQLSELFGTEYVDGSKFIELYYKEFKFIFIRVPLDEFAPQFFYYSWDILPTLLNVILNKFNLFYEPSGLRYIDKHRNFQVTNNIKFILEFLDMNFDIYKGGFFDFYSEVTYITTSIYYNNEIFEEYKLNIRDFLYFNTVKEYGEALNILSNYIGDYEFKQKDSYFVDIDSMFPGSNFLEKIMAPIKS